MSDSRASALLVDFGGVLTTPVWESFRSFCEAEGLEPDLVRELFRGDPGALADLRELETGAVEVAEFERRFGARLGVERSEGLVRRLFAGMRPERTMVSAVRRARVAGVPTALISNSWGMESYDRDLLDELFDAAVISAEVGLHKPQPAIYHLCAERLGRNPEVCVFVDDLRENCVGAESAGMTAVLHRDPAHTVARLEELLGLDLGDG